MKTVFSDNRNIRTLNTFNSDVFAFIERFNHLLNTLNISLNFHFHVAAPQISHPSGQPVMAGNLLGTVAEADTLNTA